MENRLQATFQGLPRLVPVEELDRHPCHQLAVEQPRVDPDLVLAGLARGIPQAHAAACLALHETSAAAGPTRVRDQRGARRRNRDRQPLAAYPQRSIAPDTEQLQSVT